ncbi:transglutaminase-like enzyme, predicted cysteine protease [Opitutaceae bacterium TAV1]|nr:transglutaminase [Opitutaceae bacterium TAV5]EIQ01404.1 transglutaminase-like enzyme, predicted cysteine protease [Opitutaceae bacterium TAV1]
MRLRVLHRTSYVYGEPVRESFNEARLQPVTADGQVCHHFLLKILPSTRLTHYLDFHLNYVHLFEITEPHTRLEVEATSVVTTGNGHRLAEDLVTTPLAEMEACSRLERCYDFMQSSHFVDISAEAWRFGLDATVGITDAWQAAQAVLRAIHRGFTYTPAATHVHTHMRDVLRDRRGVCQDFAHVMLGVCRSLKIPARYVSGYLYNGPEDQLRGAQASHAWVEVYLPGHGWRALDPTNGSQPDERYIKIAVGRDYSDVSPLKGTYRGTGERKLTVEVLVTDLDPVPVAG